MDEIIASYIEGQRYICVERAVDEYIQASNDLLIESVSLSDKFVDLSIEKDLDDMSEDELNSILDAEAEYYDDDDGDDWDEDDFELKVSDSAMIDDDVAAIVDELDLEDI